MKRISFFVLTTSFIFTFNFIADVDSCIKQHGGVADAKICTDTNANSATVQDICKDLETGDYNSFEDAKNSECM